MISKNIRETSEIAKKFLVKMFKKSSTKNEALVVCLSGDLGTGKTAFTKAIAKHLNIKNKVNSPTFVIIKNYPIPEQARYGAGSLENKQYQFLFHIDAYRLKNEKELLNLGWKEIIEDRGNIVFIEWPENVSGVIPSNAKFVYISHTKDGYRNFKLVL